MRSSVILFAGLLVAAQAAADPSRPDLGSPLTTEELKAVEIDVAPDGAGLPRGRGSVEEGQALFAEACASCHGEKGDKPISGSLRLTGGFDTLATVSPVQTVGSYWPYATTLFDYIRRAMPFNAPQSLTPDQVYAVSAYLLFVNGIVRAGTVLDSASLAAVRMPNRDGFIPLFRPER